MTGLLGGHGHASELDGRLAPVVRRVQCKGAPERRLGRNEIPIDFTISKEVRCPRMEEAEGVEMSTLFRTRQTMRKAIGAATGVHLRTARDDKPEPSRS